MPKVQIFYDDKQDDDFWACKKRTTPGPLFCCSLLFPVICFFLAIVFLALGISGTRSAPKSVMSTQLPSNPFTNTVFNLEVEVLFLNQKFTVQLAKEGINSFNFEQDFSYIDESSGQNFMVWDTSAGLTQSDREFLDLGYKANATQVQSFYEFNRTHLGKKLQVVSIMARDRILKELTDRTPTPDMLEQLTQEHFMELFYKMFLPLTCMSRAEKLEGAGSDALLSALIRIAVFCAYCATTLGITATWCKWEFWLCHDPARRKMVRALTYAVVLMFIAQLVMNFVLDMRSYLAFDEVAFSSSLCETPQQEAIGNQFLANYSAWRTNASSSTFLTFPYLFPLLDTPPLNQYSFYFSFKKPTNKTASNLHSSNFVGGWAGDRGATGASVTADQSLGITSSCVILIWLLLKMWVNVYSDGDGDSDCRSCCCPYSEEARAQQARTQEGRLLAEGEALGTKNREELPELKSRENEFRRFEGKTKRDEGSSGGGGLLVVPTAKTSSKNANKRPAVGLVGGVVL